MSYFEKYNPNPKGKLVGDCVKRAFTKATGLDYMEVQRELNRIKRELNQTKFNDDKVWKEFLIRRGFIKHSFPAVKGEKRMSVRELARTSQITDIWVCECAKHLVCIMNNRYYDTWDCGDKCVYIAYHIEK